MSGFRRTESATTNLSEKNVKDYIKNPDYNHALFQVASQFNLLEMSSPNMTQRTE